MEKYIEMLNDDELEEVSGGYTIDPASSRPGSTTLKVRVSGYIKVRKEPSITCLDFDIMWHFYPTLYRCSDKAILGDDGDLYYYMPAQKGCKAGYVQAKYCDVVKK